MKARIHLIVGLVGIASMTLARAAAKPAVSTMASYTSGQAVAGRLTYIEKCAECHGVDLHGQYGPALAGPASNVPWQTPLAFYSYMTQQMPVGNAGGLAPQEYLNIEAFVMQSNGRRSGRGVLTLTTMQHDPLQLDGAH